MTTKENIIDKADQFIRDKGYNAFSFKDISNDIGIKRLLFIIISQQNQILA